VKGLSSCGTHRRDTDMVSVKKDKAMMLQAFLGKLPEAIAARLAKAIEVDRLSDGKSLPHELILEGLRPALRKLPKPDRTPSPLRLFCQPFEDLLSDAPRTQKQKGRIARSSVALVWNWLGQMLAPDALAAYSIGVKRAVLDYHFEDAMTRAAEFWPVAAAAIHEALDKEATAKAARVALDGALAVEDAREIACLIAVAPEILELQEKLPRQASPLTDDLIWSLRGIYDRLAADAPDAAPYVAVIAMNRLARPWEALKLPVMISRQTQDTLIASTDMGLVGEIIFGNIEAHAAAIRATRHPDFDADALLKHLASFAELSTGIVKEVEMRRDGRWGQRLMKDRAAVAETMESLMERAPKEILAALPMHRASFSGGPRTPDISRPADPEKSDRAMRYAKLIVGCKHFAAAASFGAPVKDANEEVTVALRGYCDDLVREMRAAEGDKRANAELYFSIAAELTSLLFSPEEGEFLRRRGRAAAGPAAAA
jgi:hypothetical protein